ncbi:hypothetical protein [Methylobacterium sp. CM6246]
MGNALGDPARARRLRLRPHPRVRHRRLRLRRRDLPRRLPDGGSSRVETGYAVGGGIEFALPTDSAFNIFHTNAVTLRGKALYYDFGRRTVPVVAVGPGVGAYVARFRNEGVLGRFGLNYKFGS